MMKAILFCLLFFLTCSIYAQNNKHIGTWSGTDKGQAVNLTLKKDGLVILEVAGMVFGGKDFEMKGQRVGISYEIDYAFEAPRFTIIMKSVETNEVVDKLTGVIRFKDDTTAVICMKPASDKSPEPEFEEKDCLLFNKTK